MTDQAAQSVRKLHKNALRGACDNKVEDVLLEGIAIRLRDRHLVRSWSRGFDKVRLVDAILEVDSCRLTCSAGIVADSEPRTRSTRGKANSTYSSMFSLPMICSTALIMPSSRPT